MTILKIQLSQHPPDVVSRQHEQQHRFEHCHKININNLVYLRTVESLPSSQVAVLLYHDLQKFDKNKFTLS